MRLLIVPVVLVLLVGGVWVTGGLITDDFKVAMVLTGVWIALLGLACLLLSLRRRELAPWVMGTYLVASACVGGFLSMSVLFDKEVNENVAMADVPAAKVAPETPAARDRPAAPRNVLLGRGDFEGVSHNARGTASTIDRATGANVLTLTNFAVDNGPDLRVLLVAGPATGAGDLGDRKDLGALKGNKGNQQYTIPAGLDLSRYRRVVIWCRAFSVNFARAGLRQA